MNKMNKTRRTRLFVLVLFASLTLNSLETYQSEIHNLDALDIGPAYNIVRNPSENINAKPNSLRDGNQTKSFSPLKESKPTNIFTENDNGDKSKFEVGREKVEEETTTLLLNKQEQDVDPKLSIHDMDNSFSPTINDVEKFIYDDGTSFIIRPRITFVIEDLTGLGNELNASEWPSFFKNENYNHTMSRRSVLEDDDSDENMDDSDENTDDSAENTDDSNENADDSDEPEIGRRRSRDCKVPEFMRHSELRCKIYSSKTVCDQRCVYGYRLKNKAERRTQICHRKEGKWSPSRAFSDCKPLPALKHCFIKLRSGRKKCTYNYMHKKPRCSIDCGEKGRTTKHECDEHGRWRPALPKCAKPSRKIG